MGSRPGEPVWRRESSGRRVGTQAANLSQLAWASWPAGGSARETDLARVGAPSAPAPPLPPPSWEPLQCGSPIPAPRTLSIPPSQASGTLIDPVLPPGFSALTSLAAPAPLLAPTPRLSPICPGVRPPHLPALVPLPPHCLPRFAPAWLQAQPHSSPQPLPLCLPIPAPQPAACGPQVSSEPSAGQD